MNPVVLVPLTKLVRVADLYKLARALEIGAQQVARAWKLGDPPTVDVVASLKGVLPGHFPIFFVDNADIQNAGLAYHYFDPVNRAPAARVFVGRATGFKSGNSSVSELASHELFEAMVDPRVDQWRPHPSREGVEVAEEICDMCQSEYLETSLGEPWPLANFVTPAYFRKDLLATPEALATFLASGKKFDWLGELQAPGEVGKYGYTTLRERLPSGAWRLWLESAQDSRAAIAPEQLESKRHPLARTNIRGAIA